MALSNSTPKIGIEQEIEALRPQLLDISHTIHANPELAFKEYKAAALLSSALEQHGFSVERGSGGLETAFTAMYHAGTGGPTIALLCEYDALPEIGHACGHNIIGTVSTEEKAALAREAGAEAAILYTQQDFEAEVKRLTDGKGVQVVYDSVGKTTFDKSLNCLAPLGYMVLYGQASGPVPPFDAAILNAKGSLFLTRPSLFHYTADRASLEKRAGDVLGWIAAGKLNMRMEHTFALADVASAHRSLEGRKTTGKVLLIP